MDHRRREAPNAGESANVSESSEQDWVLLETTRALSAADAEALRQYLGSRCSDCAKTLAREEETLARLALTLPPAAPPSALRGKLLDRIASGPGPRSHQPEPSAQSAPGGQSRRTWRIGNWARYAAAAVLGLAAGVAALQIFYARPMREQLRRMSAGVSLIKFEGQTPQPRAGGVVFWDKARGTWHVQIFNLAPPAPGREYQLWFLTPDQKADPSQTFRVDASGNGSLVVNVPPALTVIAAAAVSDEPIGGSKQPTGLIHLVGTVK